MFDLEFLSVPTRKAVREIGAAAPVVHPRALVAFIRLASLLAGRETLVPTALLSSYGVAAGPTDSVTAPGDIGAVPAPSHPRFDVGRLVLVLRR